jgi:hypothetical protein
MLMRFQFPPKGATCVHTVARLEGIAHGLCFLPILNTRK